MSKCTECGSYEGGFHVEVDGTETCMVCGAEGTHIEVSEDDSREDR